MASPLRAKITAGVLVTVVFAAGLVVGMAVDRSAVANPAPEGSEEASTAPEEERTPLYAQVGPADDQKVLIDSIVVEFRKEMSALRREWRQGYEAQRDALVASTRTAIKDVFTAEQAAQYDSLAAEYDRRQAEERAARDDN